MGEGAAAAAIPPAQCRERSIARPGEPCPQIMPTADRVIPKMMLYK